MHVYLLLHNEIKIVHTFKNKHIGMYNGMPFYILSKQISIWKLLPVNCQCQQRLVFRMHFVDLSLQVMCVELFI